MITEAGITNLRIHDLKHTFCSWQAAMGTSLQVIAKTVGHADIRSTERYSHLQIDSLRESINRATRAISDAAQKKI